MDYFFGNMLDESTATTGGTQNYAVNNSHLAGSGNQRTQYGYAATQGAQALYPQDQNHTVAQSGAHIVPPADVLGQASHAALLGAQNKAHTSLYEAYIGIKHDLASKSAIIVELKGEIKDLQQEKTAYRPPLPHVPCSGAPPAPAASKAAQLVVPPPPLAPSVSLTAKGKRECFWLKEHWDTHVQGGKAANREPHWNDYITDEKGDKMPPRWHHDLWEDAKLAFNSLFYHRLDPASWSKKHSVAADYFYNTIHQKYPQFQLCENNWKLHAWATRRYADWAKNVRGGTGGLSRADPSIIQVGEKRPSNARERKVLKKPRIIKQEPANPARVPPAQKSVSTSDDSVIIVEDDDSSDEWYVDMKTVADVKERVKDSMKAPSPLALELTPEPEIRDTPTSTPAGAATGSITSGPVASVPPPLPAPIIAPIITVPVLPVAQPEASLRLLGRPVRQKKANFDPLANLIVEEPAIPIPTPAVSSAALSASKKVKGFTPSDTLLTTRNLFMIDYKAANPTHNLDQFNAALKNMDAATRKIYDTHSKELKMAKASGPPSSIIPAGDTPIISTTGTE